MKNSKKDKFLILFFCFYLATLPGCSSDSPTDANKTAPEIPPQGTMLVDFSFFQTSGLSQSQFDNNANMSKLNFLTAATVVTAFNLAVLIGISVPVFATAAALSVEPTFETDGKFHWKFNYSEGVVSFSLELTAKVNPTTVDWEMLVDSQTLDDFLWYDGQSQLDRTAGYWQFYDVNDPAMKQKAVKIDWQYVSDDDRTLTFTVNNANHLRYGDWLRYQVDGDDVSMFFYQHATMDSVEVVLNKTTGEGYILAPNYNNGEKACWDTNQDDTACSSSKNLP